jgi:3-hydroxybutyryl-CoA dehydratase
VDLPSQKFIKDIAVGMTAEYEKQVTDQDVRSFAVVSGDFNPIHLDEDFAKGTMFGQRIAHGILTASHISATLGYIFPGPGWIYLNQNLQFRAPVMIDDVVKTLVEVTDVNPEKNTIVMTTNCFVGDKLVLKGEAIMKSPD